MKNLIVFLIFTFFVCSLSAEVKVHDEKLLAPIPRLTILPYGVEVTIKNFTQDDYDCYGSLFIQYASAISSYELYDERIQSGEILDRIFYSVDPTDEILDVHDAIFCYRHSK